MDMWELFGGDQGILPGSGLSLIALLGNILGGSEEEKKETEWRDLIRQMKMLGLYESPMLKMMDPMVGQAVMNNFSRYANFGMPAGMEMDLSFLNKFGSGQDPFGTAPGASNQDIALMNILNQKRDNRGKGLRDIASLLG